MTIDEAVASLEKKLNDPEVFIVSHDGKSIIVKVNFIYRYNEVKALGDTWEGFPLQFGRISCW